MKEFTQEEYEELVELAKHKFHNSVGYSSSADKSVMEEIRETYVNLSQKINNDEMVNKAIALMNPYTRELVYNDLVEESKFVWQFSDGSVINKDEDNWYVDNAYDKSTASLTEKQIKNSPFDILKFKKINVSDFNFN